MNHPFFKLDNVTDFHPALITLRARLREAYEACTGMVDKLDGASSEAAEALAELHGHHGAQLDAVAGPQGLPAERAFPAVEGVAKRSAGADVLQGGILPGSLAVREDRVVSALVRALSLNHTPPMQRLLIEMKADLTALHDEIGLQ